MASDAELKVQCETGESRRFAGGFPVALAVVAALVLAGCAQQGLERHSVNASLPSTEAIALPPPGGPAVLGVVERRYSNAIQHTVVLASDTAVPGENFLRVQMFGPAGAAGETALPYRTLAEANLHREMREALPGVGMRRSALYAQNDYGPFGYAVGRYGARDLCLYGWQRIVPSSAQTVPFVRTGAVEVRLRLCQAGASEQSLLAVMYGYTINASFQGEGWNPYGAPAPADPRLGTPGRPIHPVGAAGLETVLEPVPFPPAPASRAGVRPAPAQRAPQPVRPELDPPPPEAPVVPPPPQDGARGVPVPPPPAAD